MASVRYHYGNFPPSNLDWERIAGPLASATESVARYDSFLGIIPDARILISPLMVQEAVTSSRIEGTRATVGEVLAFEAGASKIDPSKRGDAKEVINYQVAIRYAESLLKDLPLSGRVLRAAHSVLLHDVRGQFKSPGEYRTEQNWIGTSNNIEDARYIPIDHRSVEPAMARWEEFVNLSDIPPLVKASIAHAEFESIHPFLDGNGRIGRMIIPLMLFCDGIMSHPCFYLSEFFEHRNDEYQDRLLAVSRDDDWTGWCVFFLKAMDHQAKENNDKARMIYRLYEEIRERLTEATGSASSGKVVNELFRSAIFKSTDLSKDNGVSQKTARRLLHALEDMGTIRVLEASSGRKPAFYVFPRLIEITEGVTLDKGR